MDKPWKVISAFIAVFVAGAIFGGVFSFRASGQRLANRARPATVGQQIGPAMMQQLTHRLKLTEEQKGKIGPIVGRTAEDLQRVRRDSVQATQRAMERMHVDIAAWLTSEQMTELEQMKAALQQRVRNANNPKKAGEPEQPGAASKRGDRNPRNPNSKAEPPI
jgi:Spy/CpxP family protein refolding chaperone